MIYVLATARILPGCMQHALDCYCELVPRVLSRESGCLSYVATSDIDLGLANQMQDENEILVMERWRSVEDFHLHLLMPHCLEFRKKIMPSLREGIIVRITQDRLSAS